MPIYRIKAKRMGAWNFTVNAKNESHARKKAQKIFKMSANIPQAIHINSIEKVGESVSVRKSTRAKSHRRSKPRRR